MNGWSQGRYRADRAKIAALRDVDLWRNCSPAELRELARSCDRADAAPGEVLLRRGRLPDALYMVLDGEVQERDGDESSPRRIGPGSAFDASGMLRRVPARATFTCISRCTLLVMSQAQFRGIAGHSWLTAAIDAQSTDHLVRALAIPVA
jgi:CRP-like cAMP-binding protein